MKRNQSEGSWESYFRELQNQYPNEDVRDLYPEDPAYMSFEDYGSGNEDIYNNSIEDDYSRFMFPGGSPSGPPGGGQSPAPKISPGGGQFTINNCKKMAIVRISMRRGFNPSNFHMIVDRADNRSIRGFRIACEGGRVRFVPIALEYRNIDVIECVF